MNLFRNGPTPDESSPLENQRLKIVLRQVAGRHQTIMACTDNDYVVIH
jgi:hypothetical protein